LLQFGAPVFFFVIATYLARRYAKALQRAAQSEMLEQQARLQERLQERERIYQDLHDDVGAKLLTLVYNSKTEDDAAVARSALADIRDIVAGAPLAPDSLSLALNELHAELEARCRTANVALSYHAEIDETQQVTGELIYHLGKMLRELLSNVLRHSGASQLTVNAALLNNQLLLSFADNGAGIGADMQPGRGLAGIRRRVATLAGQLDMRSTVNGLTIDIRLPLPDPAS